MTDNFYTREYRRLCQRWQALIVNPYTSKALRVQAEIQLAICQQKLDELTKGKG